MARETNRRLAMVLVVSYMISAIMMTATPINAFVALPIHQSRRISSSTCIGMSDIYQPKTKLIRSLSKNDNVFGSTTTQTPQQWFTTTVIGVVLVSSIGITLMLPQSATASYSAYAHREEDWQQRIAQNAIQVSNPKQLRSQLREIAPMNEERSRIFCPNGPSAAVSPLMENRCSDIKQATPSVFGRSDDVVGNSIPGFSKEWTSTVFSSSAADPGGLPEYGFTKSGRK
jgi:hypothetical protein